MDPIDQKVADVFAVFEKDPDPDLLYAALNEVENVQREARTEDRDACQRGISLLLNFVRELDKQIDPKWNPKDKPERGVTPPVSDPADLVNSQTDPAAIADPALRARYEQDLETNREEVRRYRAQFHLRHLEVRAIDDFMLLAERCFTASSSDRRELQELLDSSSLSNVRKKKFRKLIRPRRWPFGN